MRRHLAAAAVATSLAATLATTTATTAAAAPAGTAAVAKAAAHEPYSVTVLPDAFLPSGAQGSAVLRWNPCRKIRYAINMAGAPKNFVQETQRAIAELSRASGLSYQYVGRTKIRPQQQGGQFLDAQQRAQHVNLVIAWDSRSASNSLLRVATGEAGETMLGAGGSVSGANGVLHVTPTQITYAAITLDKAQQKTLVKYDAKGNGLYRLLLHELGHSVGLNHVSDTRQAMSQRGTPGSPVHYGLGDKAGLKALGRSAGCL